MAFTMPDGHGQNDTTPHLSKRKSTRRSWFETPLATKFDIAVEKKDILPPTGKTKRRSIDDIETLVLTHFTATPRLGFGKVLVGRSKTRTLMVQNPNDYEQEVVVERFPFKKCFNIDQTHFVIGPSEVISLSLTWTPQEAGSCREMILFHVDEVYRLQAYVFGTAEEPKPMKKKRKGILGTSLRTKAPMNIFQTSALRNIHDSYSPRKSQEVQELRAQLKEFRSAHKEQENVRPFALDEVPQTPPPLESTAICRSNERHDQNAIERQTRRMLSPSLTRMSPILTIADTNTMHLVESYCAGPSDQSPLSRPEKNPLRSHLKVVSPKNNQEYAFKGNSLSPEKFGSQKLSEKVIRAEDGNRYCGTPRQKMTKAEKVYLSPNSFLNESACYKKPNTPEVGLVKSSEPINNMEEVGIVSPNSFLEDLNSTKNQIELNGKDYPSPSTVLNGSIPHDVMIKQLELIRTSLCEGSAAVLHNPQKPVGMFKRKLEEETVQVKRSRSAKQAEEKPKPTIFDRVRGSNLATSREKFLQRTTREKFGKISDGQSPRRKTFLISKKHPTKRISPSKGHLTHSSRRHIQGKADMAKARETAVVKHGKNAEDFPSSASRFGEGGKAVQNSVDNVAPSPPRTCQDASKLLPLSASKFQRSAWASPAVVGFTPPVLACKLECDSTGECGTSLTNSNVETPQAADVSADLDGKCHNVETPQAADVSADLGGKYHNVETPQAADVSAGLDGKCHNVETPQAADVSADLAGKCHNVEMPQTADVSADLDGKCHNVEMPQTADVSADLDGKCGIKQPACLTCSAPQTNNDPIVVRNNRLSEEMTEHAPVPSKMGSEHCGRLSTGRRLFADVSLTDSLQDMSFKPLWAGSSGTVTKDKPSVLSHLEGNSSVSNKRLFPDLQSPSEGGKAEPVTETFDKMTSPAGSMEESVELFTNEIEQRKFIIHSAESQPAKQCFNSSNLLLSSPSAEITRRATLTVTKSRPFGTLQESETPDILSVENVDMTCQQKVEIIDGEVWKVETLTIERRNSAVPPETLRWDYLTPSLLPTPQNKDNAHHSTHAVRKDKVLSEDGLLPAKLFAAGVVSNNATSYKHDILSVTNDSDEKDEHQYLFQHRTEETGSAKDEHAIDVAEEIQIETCSVNSRDQKDVKSSDQSHSPHTRALTLGSDSQSCNELECQLPRETFLDRIETHIVIHRQQIVQKSRFSAGDENCLSDTSKVSEDMSADSLEAQKRSSDSDRDCAFEDKEQDEDKKHDESQVLMDDGKGSQSQSSVSHFGPPVIDLQGAKDDDCGGRDGDADAAKSHAKYLPYEKARMSSSCATEISPRISEKAGIDQVLLLQCHDPHRQTALLPHATQQEIPAVTNTSLSKSDFTLQQATMSKIESGSKNICKASQLARRRTVLCGDEQQQSMKPELQKARSHTGLNTASDKQTVHTSLSRAGSQAHHTNSASSTSCKKGRCFHQPDKDAAKIVKVASVPASTSKSQKKPARPLSSVSSNTKDKERNKSVPTKGIVQSQLILVKKPKNTLPKHPMPFAAKNMYYDERWQDKQERGFVHWLNFVLTPPDEYNLTNSKMKVDAGSLNLDAGSIKAGQHYAPSKEVLSVRTYAARRSLNQLRRASCRLYQSEKVAKVICRIELEVESRRLAIRTDRKIHADIGIKQRILDLLLMYNPLWLRIGLETVYGEVLALQSNSDVIGLSRFILTRLLASPDISGQYAHPTVPHLYQEGYADAVARHALKKFLLLVYFLDQAKGSRLISYDPCLFCKDADIKATKELLIQFSRDYLSGEGDITKHLAYLGYRVSHAQTPLDEFDYSVKNLCTDLRDGLRLGRVIMLLSNNWQCMPSLRGPAISRLQKIHNVELIFKALAEKGVVLCTPKGGALNPRDIVDGHREKTLAFLWQLIFHFQTGAVLNEEDLREEIGLLERTLRVKLCMQRLLPPQQGTAALARRDSGDPHLAQERPVTKLLLKWCRMVCLHYGVKVENFTVSFSDGRALCCLVHHYHPGLLPAARIHFQTTQSFQEAAEEDQGDSDVSQEWGAGTVFGGDVCPELFEKLLANERENFKTLYEKVTELGGIPLMLKASDMSNTIPDERVVMTYVSYLCARLLDLRQETRAARVIQLAWRRFCVRRSFLLQRRKLAACLVIQRVTRKFLAKLHVQRQESAAVCIQAAWRGRRDRQKVAIIQQRNFSIFLAPKRNLHQQKAVLVIQSWLRALQVRRQFLKQRRACLFLQDLYRRNRIMVTARAQFLKQKQSAICLQHAFRRKQALAAEKMKKEVEEREKKEKDREKAACVMQSLWRGRKCRKILALQTRAAVVLQAWWRMVCAQSGFVKVLTAVSIIQLRTQAFLIGAKVRTEFLRLRHSAVIIQKHWRGSRQRRWYQAMKRSAVLIQKNVQRHRYATKYQTLRRVAIIIQQAWRSYLAREHATKEYRRIQAACVIIQRWIRRRRRRLAVKRELACCKIQACWRGCQARQQAKQLRETDRCQRAATKIQTWARCHLARRKYGKLRASVLLLQSWMRAVLVKKKVQELQEARISAQQLEVLHKNFQLVINELQKRWHAACIIQAWWQGHKQRRYYEAQRAAVTCLQAGFRGYIQRQHYLSLVAAAVTVQRHFRAKQRCLAGVVIQSWWRMCRERRAFLVKKSCITCLQAVVRKVIAERKYRRLLKATIFLQRKFRAILLGRAVHLSYQLMIGASVVIQAAWKMYVLRCCYLHLRQNVIKAQACCRRFLVQRHYKRLQSAAVCLQRKYRAKVLVARAQIEYTTSRSAIIKLQALVKGHCQRRQFQQTRRACIVAQSYIRTWLVQKFYRKQRYAAVVLQKRWRATILARRLRLEYQKKRMAAVTLQAAVRGHLVRKSLSEQHRAASVIQRAFWTYRTRQKFLNIKKAAVTLQIHFQALLVGRSQREIFLQTRQACIIIQAAYRGHAVQQRYCTVKQILIKLQAKVRGHQQRNRYVALREAAIVCQRKYRSKRLGEIFREAFLLIREAAIVIQKHVRGMIARRQYQTCQHSTVLIQAHVRGWLQKQKYARQKQAAVTLQNYVRAWQAGLAARNRFLELCRAAATLQATWRTLIQRRAIRRSSAAIVLQKHFRCWAAQRRYHQTLSCVVLAQAFVRGYLARKAYARKKISAVKIQKRFRETLLAWNDRQEFIRLRRAAVTIQETYRRHRVRHDYLRVRRYIIHLQAVVRGWLCRRHLQKLKQTVLVLQRKRRGNSAARIQRDLFLKEKAAADCIQRAVRAWQARKMNAKIMAAICIQSHIRTFLIRRKFLNIREAIVMLQSHVRRCQARKVMLAKRQAILTIQRQLRWLLLASTLHKEVRRWRHAAAVIQQAWREHQKREQGKRFVAAVQIQTAVRRWQQRRVFKAKRDATIVLQNALRGWQGRRQAAAKRRVLHAVVTIQAAVRAWLATEAEREKHRKRQEFLQQFALVANRHLLVIRIQRWYRRLLLQRQAFRHLSAVIFLQSWFRMCIGRQRFTHAQAEARLQRERQEWAARVLQSAFRKWRTLQEKKRHESIVTKIQAIWRGRKLRRSINNKKITIARRRVQEASETATEEKKLGNRTASALDFLLRYKRVAYILDSVMHLDAATRLSPECCERLVEVNAVGVIYRLILSCNRSLPHMEVIKFCISILLNLAKYDKTTAAVYEVPESVSTIVELMSIYREKGAAIFTKCCMLLAILGRDPQRRSEIVATKQVVEKLQSIHSLTVRKHRMQVARARVAARASLNATLPSHLPVPSSIKMRPDWVLRRDSMKEIQDPRAAVSFLLNTLHIGPKH